MNGAASSNYNTLTRPFQNPHEPIKWQMGFSNSNNKFLTAEPFGYKVNVSGNSLKKRQIWVLVPDPQNEFFYLKSHQGRYISTDNDGRVKCDSTKPGLEERLIIETHPNGSGKWAFRSVEHTFYLEGNNEDIQCFSKVAIWWNVHLAIHPQVHLKNFKRQRYVRLFENSLQGDQTIAWSYDSLITLQPLVDGEGLVVCSRDWRFLSSDGELYDSPKENCVYRLEVKAGPNTGMAFKDLQGRYLTLVGAQGKMLAKNKVVGRDELFILENSYPQVAICAENGKYTSIKQGVDVYANQIEIGPHETFQLEFENKSPKLRIRTCDGFLWCLSETVAGIRGSGKDQDRNCYFELVHLPNSNIALKAPNGLYISSRKLGLLTATSESVTENEQFKMVLLNRPLIVLRTENGFLGLRSKRVECNFVQHEAFQLIEAPGGGGFHLKISDGGFWNLSKEGLLVISDSPHPFILQMRARNKMAILAPNNMFLRAEQNGPIKADSVEPINACMFEY